MGLLKKFEGFTIWADNYKELAKWYEEVFELKKVLEVDVPEDHVIAFEIEEGSEMYLWIGSHSEVQDKNKDKYRLMISYVVEDVDELYEKIKNRNIKFEALPHTSPDNTLRVLTAWDPEDNLIQLFSSIK